MKILALETGFEDAIKHQDDDDLDRNVDRLPDHGATVAPHDGFAFGTEADGVGSVFLFDLLDLGGDGSFFFLGAAGGKMERKEDDLDHDREDDHGDAHVLDTGLAEGPIDENEDIEEGLVDIGDKKRG